VTRRAESVALLAMVALYTAIYSAACVIKYRAFLYDDIDLAIFTQALANLMRGSLGCSIRGASWLGDHSSLSLFLVTPLYAIARTPLTLLVAQSVALALGAIPVHRLARRELGDGPAALACAALYLLYPATGYLNLFEFHPEALSTPALIAAFAMLREERTRAAALWSAVALLGKEDAALVVAAMGVYALTLRRPASRAQAGWLIGLAAGSLALSFGALKPALAHGAPAYGAMYSQWGRSPGEIALALARAPWRAVAALFTTPGNAHDTLIKQQYWVQMLLPLAFLPLAAPEVLAIALPIVLEHMLSWRTQQHGIVYQYTAFVIPFALAAAVVGLGRVGRGGRSVGGAAASSAAPTAAPPPASARRFATLALLAAILAQLLFGPLLGRGLIQAAKPLQHTWPTAYDRAMAAEKRRMLARIPAAGGVVASFDVLVPLAARADLHSLHHVLSGKYTFSDRAFPNPDGVVAMLADWSGERLAIYPDAGTGARLRALAVKNQLMPVEAVGDLVLYLRAPGPGLALVEPLRMDSAPPPLVLDGELAFLGATLAGGSLAPGATLRFDTRWRTVAAVNRSFLTEWLILDRDRVVASRMRFLGYLIAPPGDWPLGEAMAEHYALPIPVSLAPGRYRLAMRVGSERGGRAAPAAASDPAVAARGGLVALGEFVVAAGHSPSGLVPQPDHPDHMDDPQWALANWPAASTR
jgi:uncharacterized membrane protein